MEVESVNKLDAACRQLDTAISLWFSDGDTVSIHTLACSAHQIVHDINKQRGNPALLHGGLIYDSLKIRDEYRRELNRFLKGPYNFFKHAEKDASGTIQFRPALTETFIIATSFGLELLGRSPGPIRAAFNIYFGLTNPDILKEKGRAAWIDPFSEEHRKQALAMPKQEFFEFYVHLKKNCLQNPEAPASENY